MNLGMIIIGAGILLLVVTTMGARRGGIVRAEEIGPLFGEDEEDFQAQLPPRQATYPTLVPSPRTTPTFAGTTPVVRDLRPAWQTSRAALAAAAAQEDY